MKKCIIVGGARIENYDFVKSYIGEDAFLIYCDSGLYHEERLGRKPDLIVGDFDSHPNPNSSVETIVLPTEKDDTDTVFAVKEALKRGFEDFLLIGVLGGRFDHSLGNLAILNMLNLQGKKGMIVDDHSEIVLISSKIEIADDCKYFSVLSADSKASGVTIKNAKYNVDKVTLTSDFPVGVSNEVPKGNMAEVSVEDGKLIIIKVMNE